MNLGHRYHRVSTKVGLPSLREKDPGLGEAKDDVRIVVESHIICCT